MSNKLSVVVWDMEIIIKIAPADMVKVAFGPSQKIIAQA